MYGLCVVNIIGGVVFVPLLTIYVCVLHCYRRLLYMLVFMMLSRVLLLSLLLLLVIL